MSEKWKISGNELMDLAFEVLRHVQYFVGGGVVYLDCENIDKVDGCNSEIETVEEKLESNSIKEW